MKVEIENNRSIQSFLSTVYTFLQSSGDVSLDRLKESFIGMEPVIHGKCGSATLDISAMVYSSLRLPSSMLYTKKVLFGQSERNFNEHGISVHKWVELTAKARRRRYMSDGKGTMAAFIASKSDLDDLVPSILTFQIEWNKIHKILSQFPESTIDSIESKDELIHVLGIDKEDFGRIQMVWGNQTDEFLREVKKRPCRIVIRNLEASFCSYRRETDEWWAALVHQFPEIEKRPIYFVSSNTHSLINILSGFAGTYKEDILKFMNSREDLSFIREDWDNSIKEGNIRRQENLLYYLLKKFMKSGTIRDIIRIQGEFEQTAGIFRFSSSQTLDVPAQIIDLNKLSSGLIDRSLGNADLSFLKKSNALILNIDYPLGRTAYFILSKIAERIPKVLGVYVIGKAASLTAESGDILIPELVHDQHTQNTYTFENCLKRKHFEDFLGNSNHQVFDNQKAITVLGTYIQNQEFIESVFSSGFTDLEMESGPYLSAIYEMINPKRHPEGESITYRKSDMELGIVHYVSDNPLRGKKLGDSSLSLDGIESTYAATLAVTERIFDLEKERMKE
jgi:hypothetical protein